MSDNVHNAIRIHHALATKAADYKKKQHVFRLQTADQSEYLFQTSDSKELQSWIDTINFVCASFSAPPLEGGVGSQKRFQRPLLPSSHTKLLMVCKFIYTFVVSPLLDDFYFLDYCREISWLTTRKKYHSSKLIWLIINELKFQIRVCHCKTTKRRKLIYNMRYSCR